jgi:Family of unknown function (DUF5996)
MTATLAITERRGQGTWPSLALAEWKDSLDTVHRWMQIVGKTRLVLAPPLNHWWHVTLYLTARGLTTSPMPYGVRSFEVDLDFIDHNLIVRTSEGATRALALVPRTVADFYREYMGMLDALGFRLTLRAVPSELEDALRFDQDREHRSYDPDYVSRCWKILSRTARVLEQFRGAFIGKCSPVHFFWGAFDLACTRFSGRRAPTHPGGVPHLPDWAVREAYSHECISAGWWPGGGPLPEPSFYSYTYPEPAGFSETPIEPEGAYYHSELREFILPYETVRLAPNPEKTLLQFFRTTYEAGATLGQWDRPALERPLET